MARRTRSPTSAGLPATKALVDTHSALHLVSPSGDAVTKLLDFWRRRGEDGTLVHDLADASLSTRFLGDLYQDLSQHAKDTYALLQTPVFVEEFILDRTLEPALRSAPSKGSGSSTRPAAPGTSCSAPSTACSTAGTGTRPAWKPRPEYRPRSTRSTASTSTRSPSPSPDSASPSPRSRPPASRSLEAAPAFTFHLAVGDSLIHGPDPDVLPGMGDRSAYMPFTYATEDGPLLLTILEEGRYDVVVGNPPYITVKDKALNQIYRSKYANVCKGTLRADRAVHGAVLCPRQRGRARRLGWPDHQQLVHEARVRHQADRGVSRPP